MTAIPAAARKPLPASPCVGVCEMDEAAGRCRGCARTGDEIALWRDADEAYRAAVWAELPDRIAAMGVNIRRLAWEPAEILDFVESTLREARGSWRFGVHGATVAFRPDPAAPPAIRREGDMIEALAPAAALRIRAPRGTRAMAWREAWDAPERILLALPSVRLGDPGPSAPTPLGPDEAALLPGGVGLPRLDLGLGRAEARVTLRGGEDALAEAQAAGAPAAMLAALRGPGAAVVAESPLGRVEAGLAADGGTIRLSPDALAEGLATPPALRMPEAYFAACMFTPES